MLLLVVPSFFLCAFGLGITQSHRVMFSLLSFCLFCVGEYCFFNIRSEESTTDIRSNVIVFVGGGGGGSVPQEIIK